MPAVPARSARRHSECRAIPRRVARWEMASRPNVGLWLAGKRRTDLRVGEAAGTGGVSNTDRVRGGAGGGREPCLYVLEPVFENGNVLDHVCLYAEAKFLKLVGELLTVEKIDWRSAVAGCFTYGVNRGVKSDRKNNLNMN